MMHTSFAASLFALLLASCSAHADSGFPERGCQPVERSIHFELHSDPWINLHHFLFQWAFGQTPRRPGDFRTVLPVPERKDLGGLAEPERAAWSRAVDHYSSRLVRLDLTFDQELVDLTNRIATISCAGEPALAGLPAELRDALEEAMPIYQKHWWSAHHARNVDWIRELYADLAPVEARIAGQLPRAYGGQWPAERLRIDVTAYANHLKGYTTNHPDRTTMASGDPDKKGWLGVETVFHEASHAASFEEPLLAQLDTVFARLGAEPPEGLSHVIQFFTPAFLLNALLRQRGVEEYEPSIEHLGLYKRFPSWGGYRAVLERHWRPFLEGKTEREAALAKIAQELSQQNDRKGEAPVS